MRFGRPDYYDEFRCIAGACSDSCCIGWEIDVDENKRKLYRSVPGELGKRLETCIDWERGSFILQGEEERCPFLNEEHLCDLIIHLGEDALCDICREHPRFYEWFDSYTEAGLGLCCEAAGRLILGRTEPVELVITEEPGKEPELSVNDPDEAEQFLFEARDQAFSLLQNRERTIWDRMRSFLWFTENLQKWLDGEEISDGEPDFPVFHTQEPGQRSDACRGLLRLCRELEAIDGSWSKTLDMLEELVSRPEHFAALETAMLQAAEQREYEYEQLAVYVVYRYFMKAREDEDVRSKGKLAVFFILLIRLLDVAQFAQTGSITTEDRVQNAKCCSKEIEYSEENLEMLSDAFWERDEVSLELLYLLLNPGYCKK